MAECKCKEMDIYQADIDLLRGSILSGIATAIDNQAKIALYLSMATEHLCEAIAFDEQKATRIASALENAGEALKTAENTASGDCSDEAANLEGIVAGLESEDELYHRQQWERLAAHPTANKSSGRMG